MNHDLEKETFIQLKELIKSITRLSEEEFIKKYDCNDLFHNSFNNIFNMFMLVIKMHEREVNNAGR